MGAACHYQVLHEVTRVPLTDDHLDSLGNRWASLSPPRVRVRLSPVLTSPTWHPLKRARFGECREHPILFAVSVKNLYDALSNLPDAALKSTLRKCDIFCEHITAKKELLQLVLKHRRNPSIWHQLASSLEGLAVFANGEPWEQFLLTAVGHRVVDDSVKDSAVGRDKLFPSNSAATHNAFLEGSRGFVSEPPLSGKGFADERVDVFLSVVVDDPATYLVAGQHVVARVDQDIVAELNAFAPLAHPGVAKLLAFTPNTLVPEGGACYPMHLVFEPTDRSLEAEVMGYGNGPACTDLDRLRFVAQLIDVSVYLRLKGLRATDLWLKTIRVRTVGLGGGFNMPLQDAGSNASPSAGGGSSAAVPAHQQMHLPKPRQARQLCLTPLCGIRPSVPCTHASFPVQDHDDAWRLSNLALQIASGLPPESLGVDAGELHQAASVAVKRLGALADDSAPQVACGTLCSAALEHILNACANSIEANLGLEYIADCMRSSSSQPVRQGSPRIPNAANEAAMAAAKAAQIRIAELEAKVEKVQREKRKLSDCLLRNALKPDVPARSDMSPLAAPDAKTESPTSSGTNEASPAEPGGNASLPTDSPATEDEFLKEAIPLRRDISVGTLASQLSRKTDEFRASTELVLQLKEQIKRQGDMFAQLFRVWTGRYSSAPVEWRAVGPKTSGSEIGAVYEKLHTRDPNSDAPRKRWLGKFSLGDASSVSELVACHAYYILSRGQFVVPKTRLAMLPLANDFTRGHLTVAAHIEKYGSKPLPHTMSKLVEGYVDLKDVVAVDSEGNHCTVKECFEKDQAPPARLYHVQQQAVVPLRGLVEVLACGVLLADVDVIGASYTNAGVLWQFGPTGRVVGATAVKVDAGCSFCFKSDQALLARERVRRASASPSSHENPDPSGAGGGAPKAETGWSMSAGSLSHLEFASVLETSITLPPKFAACACFKVRSQRCD
eukprot:INCI3314.2.p1 GENE.INCI3314.2~~INCI3314.2.p1  ORF type:complete len:1026 (+),score=163.40 INCI3314.2:223-3078(+)